MLSFLSNVNSLLGFNKHVTMSLVLSLLLFNNDSGLPLSVANGAK